MASSATRADGPSNWSNHNNQHVCRVLYKWPRLPPTRFAASDKPVDVLLGGSTTLSSVESFARHPENETGNALPAKLSQKRF